MSDGNMSSFFNERISPEHYARELLHELNFNSIPIPVEEILELSNLVQSLNS